MTLALPAGGVGASAQQHYQIQSQYTLPSRGAVSEQPSV